MAFDAEWRESEGSMVQVGKRHVLTIDRTPVVKNVLDALAADAECNRGVPDEIRRGFREFSNRGGTRLILDLQVIESPVGEPSTIKNISAYLAGEVLIVIGQVTLPWIDRIREHCRRYSFSMQLASCLRALFSGATAQAGTALGVASPMSGNEEDLGPAHAQ